MEPSIWLRSSACLLVASVRRSSIMLVARCPKPCMNSRNVIVVVVNAPSQIDSMSRNGKFDGEPLKRMSMHDANPTTTAESAVTRIIATTSFSLPRRAVLPARPTLGMLKRTAFAVIMKPAITPARPAIAPKNSLIELGRDAALVCTEEMFESPAVRTVVKIPMSTDQVVHVRSDEVSSSKLMLVSCSIRDEVNDSSLEGVESPGPVV